MRLLAARIDANTEKALKSGEADLCVLECPFAVPQFTVKQHGHERYHEDAGNRWLRSEIASLFLHK